MHVLKFQFQYIINKNAQITHYFYLIFLFMWEDTYVHTHSTYVRTVLAVFFLIFSNLLVLRYCNNFKFRSIFYFFFFEQQWDVKFWKKKILGWIFSSYIFLNFRWRENKKKIYISVSFILCLTPYLRVSRTYKKYSSSRLKLINVTIIILIKIILKIKNKIKLIEKDD